MRRATAALLGDCHVGQISIHALHEESDFHVSVTQLDIVLFQSTLSMRRATTNILPVWGYEGISIHALHEESDSKFLVMVMSSCIFQSTLSMRRATVQLDIFVRFLRRKPAA